MVQEQSNDAGFSNNESDALHNNVESEHERNPVSNENNLNINSGETTYSSHEKKDDTGNTASKDMTDKTDVSSPNNMNMSGKATVLETKGEVYDVEGQADVSAGEDDGLPVDRGWAWMVLAGSFLNIILLVGYGRAIGLLFVEYLKVFEASATKTTLFMGVMAGMFSLASLFSMNLILQLIGVRKIVLLGGAITSLGMLSAVFATSITFLICTHSILIGIGHSMIHGPALVLINQYFKKRRGLATAISMSGISLGGSLFPPVIRYFLDEYGIRGSMLLLTGLTMNLWVGGLLYRPLESFRKRLPKHKNLVNDKDTQDRNDVTVISNEDITSPLLSPNTEEELLNSNSKSHKRDRPVSQYSQCSHSELTSKGQLDVYRSNPELTSLTMLNAKDEDQKSSGSNAPDQTKTCFGYLKMVVVSLDFSLFKYPMFQLIGVTSSFAVIFVLVSVYLPALAKEKGVPETEASLLITVYSSVDFFTRLAVGYIADLKRIKVHNLVAIGVILAGTATHFASLYSSFAHLVVFSVVLGLFGSFYNCLIPVFIVELMGQKHMAKTLGFIAVFHGITISLTHPILGAIRDLTGSYIPCFNYIGACNYIVAVCLLCEPLVRRRARKLDLLTTQEEKQETGH